MKSGSSSQYPESPLLIRAFGFLFSCSTSIIGVNPRRRVSKAILFKKEL